ncbi:hypothetical protein SETIT_8G187700v2 [Setaria italica]|uniref:Uncharacterized protein n=1 Tax=Setaria italica TaxID=4555 RepID=A0A368S9A3_SETIT|nr:hypothetical protein SETIT_8G187700v2 [Setaria italica]
MISTQSLGATEEPAADAPQIEASADAARTDASAEPTAETGMPGQPTNDGDAPQIGADVNAAAADASVESTAEIDVTGQSADDGATPDADIPRETPSAATMVPAQPDEANSKQVNDF